MSNYEEWRTYPPPPQDEGDYNSVDVVLPWLNPTKKWFDAYRDFCEDEDPCRIRDLNTIQPTLSGILKNLSWVRYVWLIVYDEEQLVDVTFPELHSNKIRIVYHRDIIPKEFLPNFNSLVCAMYIHKISGLSDRFLFFNDDMIVTTPVPKETYFIGERSVHQRSKRPRQSSNTHTILWGTILENTHSILKKITGGVDFDIDNYHVPVPLRKDLIEYLWVKFNDEFYASCVNARIRKPHSISLPELAYWVEELYDYCVYNDIYKTIKRCFLVLCDTTTKDDIIHAYRNADIVCLNDSEGLQNKYAEIGQYIKEVVI